MGIQPTIQLGSLGMADSLILMVLALVVFGPRRLPQIGRQIGKLMFEFRKASNDFKFQMEEELRLAEDADRRKKEEEKRKQLAQESVSATPAVVKTLESLSADGGHDPNLKVPKAEAPEEAPRVLPPSTGEPVAAASRSERAEASTDSPSPASDPASPLASPSNSSYEPSSSAPNESAKTTETVNQNG